ARGSAGGRLPAVGGRRRRALALRGPRAAGALPADLAAGRVAQARGQPLVGRTVRRAGRQGSRGDERRPRLPRAAGLGAGTALERDGRGRPGAPRRSREARRAPPAARRAAARRAPAHGARGPEGSMTSRHGWLRLGGVALLGGFSLLAPPARASETQWWI